MIVTVSSQSYVNGMTAELLAELDKCSTLNKIKTPNKVHISCDYPLEGRYVALIKDSEVPDSFSINEFEPILLGTSLYSPNDLTNTMSVRQIQLSVIFVN